MDDVHFSLRVQLCFRHPALGLKISRLAEIVRVVLVCCQRMEVEIHPSRRHPRGVRFNRKKKTKRLWWISNFLVKWTEGVEWARVNGLFFAPGGRRGGWTAADTPDAVYRQVWMRKVSHLHLHSRRNNCETCAGNLLKTCAGKRPWFSPENNSSFFCL